MFSNYERDQILEKKNKLRIKIILYILINNLDIHFSFFKILFSTFWRVLVHIYIISFYSN